MTFDILVEFNAWLTECDYAEQSKRTYLAFVTEYLRYAQDAGWLPSDFPIERAVYRKRFGARDTGVESGSCWR